MKEKKHAVECACCKLGRKEFERRQREILEKFGWYIHAVAEGKHGLVNFHTHHVPESFGHKDFQIVFPVEKNVAGGVFHALVDMIKNGSRFEEGDSIDGILKGMPVGFFETKEGDRDVLRVIFPDEKGELNRYKIEPPLDLQFEHDVDIPNDECDCEED